MSRHNKYSKAKIKARLHVHRLPCINFTWNKLFTWTKTKCNTGFFNVCQIYLLVYFISTANVLIILTNPLQININLLADKQMAGLIMAVTEVYEKVILIKYY